MTQTPGCGTTAAPSRHGFDAANPLIYKAAAPAAPAAPEKVKGEFTCAGFGHRVRIADGLDAWLNAPAQPPAEAPAPTAPAPCTPAPATGTRAAPAPAAMPAPAAPDPNWRAVRDAYYLHHQGCPVCIAAGKGYGLRCGIGAALWRSYSNPPDPREAPRHHRKGTQL